MWLSRLSDLHWASQIALLLHSELHKCMANFFPLWPQNLKTGLCHFHVIQYFSFTEKYCCQICDTFALINYNFWYKLTVIVNSLFMHLLMTHSKQILPQLKCASLFSGEKLPQINNIATISILTQLKLIELDKSLLSPTAVAEIYLNLAKSALILKSSLRNPPS